MRNLRAWLGLLSVLSIATSCPGADNPTATLRDDFESARTIWKQEQTDANITLQAHERSERAAHQGRMSERFAFNAGVGSSFYYSYALPKIPVVDGLKVGLYVRSNRSGVQLFARVILPADVDPETGQPSFLLVPGTIYDDADRWQQLELLDLPTSLERQARVLRSSSKRKVSLEGAYVEQLVVNLFTSAGQSEVFLDELTISPVPEKLTALPTPTPPSPSGAGEKPSGIEPPITTRKQSAVRLDNNQLKKRAEDGLFHDWVPTGIFAPGADVTSLRDAGFDLLIDDIDGDLKRAREASRLGFMLMPILGRDADGKVLSADRAFELADTYPLRDSVAFWDVGDQLGRGFSLKGRTEELAAVRAITSRYRDLPPGVSRLVTGLVDDDLRRFARDGRAVSLIGIRPPSWGSSVPYYEMLSFLRQRRDLTALTNGGAFYWAMLPATPPASIPRAIWGQDAAPSWGDPLIQPEQLRLMTYAALAAGYRGLAFQADERLTRPNGLGRILLLEMALLNAEIDLTEAIIANGADPIPMYPAFDPDPPNIPPPGGVIGQRTPVVKELAPLPTIKSAALGLSNHKGVLLIVGDYAINAQFQPPQSAKDVMKLTVVVPEGALAYSISPGQFKAIEESEKYVGGRRYTLTEFDSTALLLITTDALMAQRVEAVVNSIRPRASMMAIEQAERKLAWTTEIVQMLDSQGHPMILEKERARRLANGGTEPTDQADLLRIASENIRAARENHEREDYANAWAEARRASRPLRQIMRIHWDNAVKAMIDANTLPEDLANENLILIGKAKRKGPLQIVPPVASAPLVAFNTLPQHYVWVDTMRNGQFSKNLVPSGSFDEPQKLEKAGWVNQSVEYEGIKTEISPLPIGKPDPERKRYLVFRSLPIDREKVDTLPPALDFPSAAIRTPAVKVKAGEFYRISVDVLRALNSAPGRGGVVIRDSIGGEALQFSSASVIPAWTKVVLYRRAIEDGELTVTLGLAGYGGVTFDDFRIERAESPAEATPPDIARFPGPEPPVPTARREQPTARPNR
jgi:hypothetical protein